MRVMRVIEQEQGRYEVREVPYGTVYSWNPGYVRVECDCGTVLEWTGSGAMCECGARHEGILEGLESRNEGDDHPWLEDYEEWREEKEANDMKHEYYAFVEAENGV